MLWRIEIRYRGEYLDTEVIYTEDENIVNTNIAKAGHNIAVYVTKYQPLGTSSYYY